MSLEERLPARRCRTSVASDTQQFATGRSEEHTSELQSRVDLVCRLLLEKKKNDTWNSIINTGYRNIKCSKSIKQNATLDRSYSPSRKFRHCDTTKKRSDNTRNSTTRTT